MTLERETVVMCLERVKKIQDAGFTFKEVAVNHFFRAYGTSQFFNFRRIFRVGIGIIQLWWQLVARPKLFGGAAKAPAKRHPSGSE